MSRYDCLYAEVEECGLEHADDCSGVDCLEDHEGVPPCSSAEGHDWTREGMSGCSENPGVWGVGGTATAFAERCSRCGAERHYTLHGAQRNPGQCDSLRYVEVSS